MKQHTGENRDSGTYATVAKSPPSTSRAKSHTGNSQIAIPKSYPLGISASQPVTKTSQTAKSSVIIQKRALSLSPNNSSTSQSPVPQKKAANQTSLN